MTSTTTGPTARRRPRDPGPGRPTRTAATASTPPALRAVWQAHLEEHDRADCAFFGPRPHVHGRLLDGPVPELLEPFVRGLLLAPPGPTDIVPFTRLDGATASELLDVLEPRDLDDRQNEAPTLRAILEATAAHPDRLDVHGYAVGPGRCDERLTAEGVHVRFDDDVRLPRRHDEGCDCGRLWSYVVDELGLDDDGARCPDEIVPAYRSDDERWWRLWWD